MGGDFMPQWFWNVVYLAAGIAWSFGCFDHLAHCRWGWAAANAACALVMWSSVKGSE